MNAIIIGASSGIGAQLARDLAENGYSLGLVARRRNLLDLVAATLPTRTITKVVDLNDPDEARRRLAVLIDEMGGVDLFVISSGVRYENPNLDKEAQECLTQVNAACFAAGL